MKIIAVHFVQRVDNQLFASHREVYVETDDYQIAVNVATMHCNGNTLSKGSDPWVCTSVNEAFSGEVLKP